MKTFLGYLTFAALLALCYLEKINAEAAKNEARVRAAGQQARTHTPVWAGRHLTVAQLGQ